jgi:hypothetical protein
MINHYIITEDEWLRIYHVLPEMAHDIHSHPYNPQFTQDELSDLFIIVDANIDRHGKNTKTMKLLNKIEELRKGEQG